MKLTAQFLVTAVIAVLLPVPAAAQTFPTRPIRIIVGFPAGGGIDVVARLMAPKLASALGQPVLVDNRVGADGIVATEAAAKSPPDGHTIFFGNAGNLAINQSLYSKVPFDIGRDFAAVTQLVSVDMMLTTHPSLPARTTSAIIALAKARPGELDYASSGVGGIPHLAMELFNFTAGTKITHVPYKGGIPALTDLTGGHIPIMVQSLVQGLPIVKAGKLRAIAVLSPKRSALLPEVPAAAETLPGYEATNWFAAVVPANTPAAIHKRIYDEIVKLMRLPELKDLLIAQGAEPVGGTPEQLAAFMKAETAKWARVIKEANIRAE